MTQYPDVTIEQVLQALPVPYRTPESLDFVRRAYDFAYQAHDGQKRKSGKPYIEHPLQVAYLLTDLHLEPAAIAAGLLHDVVEDCKVKHEQLAELFGEETVTLVEAVTKIEKAEKHVKQDSERDRDQQELESLRKMFVAMAEDDLRVIFIKLADRLHNMRTLEWLPRKSQLRMARETLDIFAPIANRLGLWSWKAELEDLAFHTLNPGRYGDLAKLLAARKEERQQRVTRLKTHLQKVATAEGIVAEVKGRPKHIYSINQKINRKNVSFERVYDAEALRVIVATEPECYQLLGIVHRLWKPVPGEFDDYIANPKPNGYQSLHTAVMTDDGGTLEIQIRSREMDCVAEYGVATHWLYKEQGLAVSQALLDHMNGMRQSVRELTQDSPDAQDFIEIVRSDVFEEYVYAFTPNGRVIDMPRGATPIDFAYRVHTDLGHRCRGARINGKWVGLDYQIKTGDQVMIIPGRSGGPGRDWLIEDLGYVKTNRAKQKIRQWFRQQDRDQNIKRGRAIVEREIRRLGLDWPLDEVAELFTKRYPRAEDFWAAVGMGDFSTERIVDRLEEVRRRQVEEAEAAKKLSELEQQAALPPLAPAKVDIRGTSGLLTRLALCCKPIPGEEIVGYVTRGRGVTIHKRECPNVLRLVQEEPERLIEMEWGTDEVTFQVRVAITAYDRSGLFHDITEVLDRENVNMAGVNTGERDRFNIVPVYLTLEVPNYNKLKRVLGKIEHIPNVLKAKRIG